MKGRIHKRIWIREISLRGLKIANGGIALRRFLNEEERVFRLKREKYSKGGINIHYEVPKKNEG